MIFIPCIMILIYAMIVATYFKTTFAKALPSSIILMIFIVYLSGFLDNLLIGIYALCVCSIIYIALLAINYKNVRECFVSILKDRTIIVFVILYLLICLYEKEAYLKQWDEFMHWGSHAKDMFIRNKFYFTEGHIAVNHISYPPLQATLQYIFARLENTFNDAILYRAQLVLIFSIIFPIFDFVKNAKTGKYLFTILLTFIYYIAAFRICAVNPLSTILTDHTLGFLFTALMIKSFEYDVNDDFHLFDYIMNAIALVLVKQTGITLFLGAFIVLIIMQFCSRSSIKKEQLRNNIIRNVLIFAIPTICIMVWFVFVRLNNITDQFDIDKSFTLSALINILFKNGGLEYQKATVKNFLYYFANRKIIFLTYYQWIILFILCYIGLNIALYKKYGKKLVIFSILSILGFFAYTFVILISYLFGIEEKETIELVHLWRYLSSYAVSIPLILGYFIIKESALKEKVLNKYSLTVILISTGLIISILISKQKYAYKIQKFVDSTEYQYKVGIDIIDKLDSNANILLIQENQHLNLAQIFKYYNIDKNFSQIDINKRENIGDNIDMTVDELREKLKEFDYIYFSNIDEDFYNLYGNLFEEKLENRKCLYKILWNNNELILEKIE